MHGAVKQIHIGRARTQALVVAALAGVPMVGLGCTLHFYAGYALAGAGQPTAGNVNTSVTYSLVYQ